MRPPLLALFLAAGAALYGADHDFDRIAKAVEAHYGVKRMHIPLMGVANFALKVAHPAGAKSVKIAIFEDIGSAKGYGDPIDLDRLFDELAASGLKPMIRARSRHGAESTYICMGDAGKYTRVLIATFEPNEATVVEVEANFDALMKIIGDPGHAGQMFGQSFGGRKDRDW